MGVLSDLIIGTEAELANIPPDKVPINVLPGLDIKGVDIVKLATLHSLLTGAEFDPALEAFPSIGHEDPEDGPWVFRVPDDLVEHLARTDDAGVAELGARWALQEEFTIEGWEQAEVVELLRSIHGLARRALQDEKPLHLWTSL